MPPCLVYLRRQPAGQRMSAYGDSHLGGILGRRNEIHWPFSMTAEFCAGF